MLLEKEGDINLSVYSEQTINLMSPFSHGTKLNLFVFSCEMAQSTLSGELNNEQASFIAD